MLDVYVRHMRGRARVALLSEATAKLDGNSAKGKQRDPRKTPTHTQINFFRPQKMFFCLMYIALPWKLCSTVIMYARICFLKASWIRQWYIQKDATSLLNWKRLRRYTSHSPFKTGFREGHLGPLYLTVMLTFTDCVSSCWIFTQYVLNIHLEEMKRRVWERVRSINYVCLSF